MSGIIRWQMDSIGSIDFNVIIANIFGVPLFFRGVGICRKYFVTFLFLIVLVLCNCIYVYCELIDLAYLGNSLNKIAQNSCLTVTHIGGNFKLLVVLFRLKNIIAIAEEIKDLPTKYALKQNQQKIFNLSEIENKLILFVYALVVTTTAIFGIVLLIKEPNIGGNKFPYRSLLPVFLPLGVRVTYWGLSVMVLALQIVSIDCFYVNLMNQLRCNLKFLSVNLEELISEEKSSNEAVEILERSIKHHIIILRLRNEIESIFKFPVLMQFMVSMIIIVMTGFQAVILTKSEGVLMIYFYCGCIFSQLFAYCFFANQVTEENKFIAFAVYNTAWYSFDSKYAKMLIIFMINSQRPFTFTVGGFFDLSLNSFSGILSRSYSYIAILRQVYTN